MAPDSTQSTQLKTEATPSTPATTTSVVESTPAKKDDSTPNPEESEPSSSSSAEPTASSSKDDATPSSPKPSTTEAQQAETKGEEVIDMETFQQIIDLDDEDDDHEFAKGMVEAYFAQAEETFDDMDNAFSKKDLPKLSSLGHYLKGSSAALGVKKVQASCEDIQHYGQKRDEKAGKDLTDPDALDMIKDRISQAKEDYVVAEEWLKKWIKDNEGPAASAAGRAV